MYVPLVSNKPTVLILCTGNSCRSHIAEGILRQAAGDFIDAQSAGSKPAGYVHPKAIEVMREIGIDISGHRSKHFDEFLGQKEIETVITVCGNADQACPMFPGQVNRYHWGFDDPAKAQGTDEAQFAVFAVFVTKCNAFSKPMPQAGATNTKLRKQPVEACLEAFVFSLLKGNL